MSACSNLAVKRFLVFRGIFICQNVKFWREVGFKLILEISFFCQHNSTGGGFLILKQIIEHFIYLDFFSHSVNYT
jgi:hypothetical protein